MGWTYRIVKTKVKGEIRYGIHEVHTDDGELSWTKNPVTVDTFYYPEDLREILENMLKACDKPIVDGTK